MLNSSQLRVAASMISIVLLLTCGVAPITDDQIPGSPVSIDYKAAYQSLTDDELVDRLATGLDICLTGEFELLFTESDAIPANTLFVFFAYILNQDDPLQPHINRESYYQQDKDIYTVPIEDIQKVLDRYFESALFTPQSTLYYEYIPPSTIQTKGLSGFGGGRFPVLASKEFSSDELILVVDYYDDQYEEFQYEKTYHLKFTPEGFKYLSITKQFVKSEAEVLTASNPCVFRSIPTSNRITFGQ